MQDDPSKRIDPEHPAMRTLFALFDGAMEFGLSRAEVSEVVSEALEQGDPRGPLSEPIIGALAQRIEDKGIASGDEFRRHTEARIAPLLREAQEALGLRERGSDATSRTAHVERRVRDTSGGN
jgi:hypothetical protein